MSPASHVILRVFDSEFDALAAIDQLLSHGFERHNIHISDRDNTNRSLLAHEGDGHEGRVARFFKTLFHDNETEARKYTDIALESGAVIVAVAFSQAEANKAADILDNAGSMNPAAGNIAWHKSRVVNWGSERQTAWEQEKRLNEAKIW